MVADLASWVSGGGKDSYFMGGFVVEEYLFMTSAESQGL